MSNKATQHPDLYKEYSSHYPPEQEDEIDLFELFSVLFQSKYLIIAISFAFAIIGFGIASFLPQKWSSTAVVVQPRAVGFQPLQKVLTDLQVLNIESGISQKLLYERFLGDYDSRVLREEYVVNTDYFKALVAKNKVNTEQERRKLIEQIINSISIPKKKNNDDENISTLSFSADNAQDAYNLLAGYIKFVSSVVQEEVTNELNETVQQKLEYSQKMYSIDLARIENTRSVNIERLKNAISIAHSAGIEKPGILIKDDPDYSIGLGADALKRKLQVIEEDTDPTKTNFDMANRLLYMERLGKVKIDTIDFTPFKYMQKPYEPTSKDSPKRLLILVGAGFIGFILSIMFVLLRHMVRTRQKKEA
ncbi:LPS O-antigen length regulator Wzz(fepE) [Xenorhabdus szentirmaii]|uniref:LPS O-antigen length regulator Wzz(fepE) n=1 Tax=Xenorhabdus szentirmaii TaxID=290112 RepID=UPI00198B6433|nr:MULTISPECIES: LPS O-antigen length regulator Wzz(fepE) [unclassified Xenorhabdus]MBD2791003.1 LPS O-antigen length regulator [Xenorhabdus sp. CUL]MBD2825223.1 LPS O-antigen length regulator [Xenorhabdus sp. 5]